MDDDGGCGNDPRLFDEELVRPNDFGREPVVAFAYIYDFGDDWAHAVEIE